MSYCNLKGTITFTLTSSEYNRRIGGFVGDASRVVSLDHCENSGTMVLYDKGYGVNGFGGLIGRTTKQTDGYTMSFTVTNSTFSGSMTVYAPTSDRATSLSETTNNFGTLIGCNAATTGGVTIDGESYTSGSSLNYSGTSVSFLVEP